MPTKVMPTRGDNLGFWQRERIKGWKRFTETCPIEFSSLPKLLSAVWVQGLNASLTRLFRLVFHSHSHSTYFIEVLNRRLTEIHSFVFDETGTWNTNITTSTSPELWEIKVHFLSSWGTVYICRRNNMTLGFQKQVGQSWHLLTVHLPSQSEYSSSVARDRSTWLS